MIEIKCNSDGLLRELSRIIEVDEHLGRNAQSSLSRRWHYGRVSGLESALVMADAAIRSQALGCAVPMRSPADITEELST